MNLNCDVGELTREIDHAILPFVHSCNVCCGAHAGDETLIESTVREAVRLDVNVGAHPSWPDREHFGRRSLDLPMDQLKQSLLEQIELVKGIAERLGTRLTHVKPHGALYHDAIRRDDIADVIIAVVQMTDPALSICGMANSDFGNRCIEHGIDFINEAFGDRIYENEETLRSRNEPEYLITDTGRMQQRLQMLKMGKVMDCHGRVHELKVDSICIHSDTPNAIELARFAHEFLLS